MAVGILSRLIEVEFVMRVLDKRYAKTFRDETWNYFLDQGSFAATGVACDADGLHIDNLAEMTLAAMQLAHR